MPNLKHWKESFSTNSRIIWMSFSGKTGIILLILFLVMAGYVVAFYYPTITTEYAQGVTALWPYKYPVNAPPCWSVSNKFNQRIDIRYGDLNKTGIEKTLITVQGLFGPIKIEGYKTEYFYKFKYKSNAFPSDVLVSTAVRVGENVSFIKLYYTLDRPDGSRITFYDSTLQTGKITALYGAIERKGNNISVLPLGLTYISQSNRIYSFLMRSLQKLYANTSIIVNPIIDNELLFAKVVNGSKGETLVPLKGDYTINITAVFLPEKGVSPTSNRGSVNLTSFEWKFMPNCYGLFGTDNQARPIGLGLLLGVPFAFVIGFTVTFVSTFVGAIYGTLAGFWKDIRGEALMRVADIVNSLPFLPILIVLSYIFRQSITLMVLAGLMILLFWAGPVIVIRSAALQISEQLYVEAARASGAGASRIIFRHIFPQVLPYTIAIAVLSIPGIIVTEAGLALLGFGDPTAPTWGKMLQNAYNSQAILNGWWWTYLFPGLALVVFSATFLLLGRAIEPIVAPKLQK
ncbi:MAG: ABC transporter permease [Desulfurococcales archaeon]|nr:ABC transporter permease [Desulfurococcales archaeon]